MREVHHRVKNNISSVEGLLSLQADSTVNAEAKSALQEAVSRVQSVRVLYDRLLLSRDLDEVSIKTSAESLIESQLMDFVIPVKQENTVTLIIQDDGQGFDERALANRSPGFGRAIVRMLVEQLGGSYQTMNENGARSVVQFEM